MGLSGRHIVVGVAGGIAAFKSVELVRELTRRGAEVRVAMTPSGARFIGPVTFTGITGRPAVVDLWDPTYAGEVHVELAAWADAVVVVPATANLLARAAQGFADDAVLATLRCADVPVVFAPAMHTNMWRSAPTQRAVATLRGDGAHFVGPVSGPLASGEVGEGRMADPSQVADALEAIVTAESPGDLSGRRVLVSAGPTIEDVDPVRFLSNRSSGRMGYAVATRARERGAEVVLVSGPVSLACPAGVKRVDVRSAREMHEAVMARADDVDVVVMTAAVADYRPKQAADHKLKKSDGDLVIELERNPDILADLGAARAGRAGDTGHRLPVLVGFALETQDVVANGRGKLQRKAVDLIVANHASDGFGGDTNVATLVGPDWECALPELTKRALADEIWNRVAQSLGS